MELKNKLFLGDSLEIMRKIPDNSISACVTDPPYNYEFIGMNWDKTEIERRKQNAINNESTLVKNIPYGSGLAGGVRNERWYKKNRENILEYQKWCESWGKELYRIAKPGALILVFNSSRTVAQVQVALENCGFYARDMIIWRRQSGIPKGLNLKSKLEKLGVENADSWNGWHSCLRNEWEGICVVQKPLVNNYITTLSEYGVGLFKTNLSEGFQSNILEDIKRDNLDEFNIHCTVKPLELIEKLVEMIVPLQQNNIVIDPFLGSGTTAVACKKLGVSYVGIDINQDYLDIAQLRLNKY